MVYNSKGMVAVLAEYKIWIYSITNDMVVPAFIAAGKFYMAISVRGMIPLFL